MIGRFIAKPQLARRISDNAEAACPTSKDALSAFGIASECGL